MQIWEAETLHMSQLAGGWDFLTLSDWRCAPKSNNKWYYKRSCSCGEAAAGAGGAASPGRTAGHGQTEGQKELLKSPQKQQGWCCLCPGGCIPALSRTNPDRSAGCVRFSLQSCEGAAECDFFW